MQILFELPWIDKRLGGNSKLSGLQKSPFVKRDRLTGKLITESALKQAPALDKTCEIRIKVLFRSPDAGKRSGREWDLSNLIQGFKAFQDGISDALGVDDGKIEWTYKKDGRAVGGLCAIELNGEPLPFSEPV